MINTSFEGTVVMYVKGMLNQANFFQSIEPQIADSIKNQLIVRKYKKRMLVFMEGEPADHIYFVLQGKVKLSKVSDDGQEKIVLIIPDGQFFGEVPVLDKKTHPLTAETLEEAEIGMLKGEEFRNYLLEYPQISYIMMEIMAKRLRQSFRQIKNLALKNTTNRLASRLYKLTREYGVETKQGISINAIFTQQDLANMIGASRETVSRTLKEFEKAGVLEIVRQKITIKDMKKLKELF